ncbi:MAG: DUF2200 domain-containing protein [Bacteroidia bacterium]|nr:DUF2200 domain-containing protein [Bacteroidia bacterium]
MKTTKEHDEKIAKISFASVYPMYVKKVERKGRTETELLQVIEWLTGFSEADLKNLMNENVSFETFFNRCNLNPNAHLIKGTICGYKIQEIETPLTKHIRYLDKLVDELANGKSMDKILRS